MSRSDQKRLDDILGVAEEVAAIVERGRDAFDADIALRRALERCLEIIGEAAKALSNDSRHAIADVPWSEIIRLRDLLSHRYHRIEPDQLWVTAERDIPDLASAVAKFRQGAAAESPEG